MTEIQKVRNDLKLSEKRMRHTEGVVRAAVLLASRHFPEIAPETAELAALFHDYTKEYTVQQHLQVLASYGQTATEDELEAPKLLHARTAALIAEKEYRLSPEIVSAIRWHTTGRENMSPLECVIYFADYIEDTRTFPACVRLREYYEKQYASLKDKDRALHKALVRSFDITIRDLLSEGKTVDPNTVSARNHYLRGRKKGI
ncbi:MAG: bis(5'-nucleosyl)-tetraphosphatase (symmetrical) YqeK [Clostridia bacterium]|nr:bis(5'-nucleosyl)-tetraphosphatase (symmetrical) YqeK [Clostridia bacterium]